MVNALHTAGHPWDGGLWHCDVGQWHLGRLRHGKMLQHKHAEGDGDAECLVSQSRQFHVAFDSTMFMFALWTHYLSEAGRGSWRGLRRGGGVVQRKDSWVLSSLRRPPCSLRCSCCCWGFAICKTQTREETWNKCFVQRDRKLTKVY